MFPKILVMPGSTGHVSPDVRLARVASLELAVLGADVTRISLEDYPLPLIDPDPAEALPVPENACRLAALIRAHDGFLLCCPERNASVPAAIKNMIDWIDHVRGSGATACSPWRDCNLALATMSGGPQGESRMIAHLEAIMEELGARLVPQSLTILARADSFDEDGRITDPADLQDIKRLCRALYEASGGS